jgi:4-hydroxy-2,2'-bipyrrole-5-methanol dehydrogenase
MLQNKDFAGVLELAIKTAALSPSSHNSQPWGLGIVRSNEARSYVKSYLSNEEPSPQEVATSMTVSYESITTHINSEIEYLVLALDKTRELTSLLSHKLEMILSCGMYFHLLLETFFSHGWNLQHIKFNENLSTHIVPSQNWPAHWVVIAVAAISATPTSKQFVKENSLLSEVSHRVTNRAPYKSELIPKDLIARVSEQHFNTNQLLQDTNMYKLALIVDKDQIKAMGNFVGKHAGIDFVHKAAWKETYRYIRFCSNDIDKAEDGFPITQLFGPLSKVEKIFYRFALSPTTMSIMKYFGYHKKIAKELGNLVSGAPLLAVFSFNSDSPSIKEQVLCGGNVMNFWLKATAEKLAMHPISVILQHEEIREQFQNEFNIAGRAFFFGRLGYATMQFPQSPRLQDKKSYAIDI